MSGCVIEFQSLFWWNSLSDLNAGLPTVQQWNVSILVLVELPFRRGQHRDKDRHERCFNPCFGGTPFQTARSTHRLKYHQYVSILVLVELPFRRRPPMTSTWFSRRFNPCFGGTPFQTHNRLFEHCQCGYVSILVLVELPFRHCETIRVGYEQQLFQSLFWWNSLSD